MLTLASGVMDLRVPVVLVIPMTLSYSYLDATTPNPTAEDETSDDSAAANDDTRRRRALAKRTTVTTFTPTHWSATHCLSASVTR